MNMDENLIEQAITERTKAIVPVHYAGVACEMDAIMALAEKYHLKVVEDAAQGVEAYYHGKALGTIGDFGCYSSMRRRTIPWERAGLLFSRKMNTRKKQRSSEKKEQTEANFPGTGR